MAYLVVLEGLDIGKVYELYGEKTIGSANDNDIVLEDRRVYSYHLSISSNGHHSFLSTHFPNKPVEINGKNTNQRVLQEGDIIRIGSTMLIYAKGDEKEEKQKNQIFSFLPLFLPYAPPKNQKILSSIQVEEYKLKAIHDSQKNKSLKTLIEVDIAISEIPNISLLLEQILKILLQEIKADRAFIMLVQKNQKWEIVSLCQREGCTNLSSFECSKAITKKIITRKMSLLYNSSSIERKDIPSCISVPLNRKNKLLGLIQMESFSGYFFKKHELEQLQKVAQRTAIAIENFHFYQQPLHYYQKLILLEKFSQEFCQSLKFEKIVQEAAKAASTIFMSKRVFIFFQEEAENHLNLVYSTEIPQEKWDKIKIPFDKSLLGQAFLKNKPVLLQNTKNILWSCYAGNEQKYSCILSPIPLLDYQRKATKKPMGIICVVEKKDNIIFTRQDLKLLVFFANQLGASLTNSQLYEKATTDFLTKVYSRGYFFQCLQEKIFFCQEEGSDLSLLMLDIDEFKKINDIYNHLNGDCILQQTGNLLKFLLTKEEIVGRYGGEEFLILLCEQHHKAMEKAQMIQEFFSQYFFWIEDKSISLTVSIGVSTLRKQDVSQSLIERADQALYLAKKKGRNLVISEREIV